MINIYETLKVSQTIASDWSGDQYEITTIEDNKVTIKRGSKKTVLSLKEVQQKYSFVCPCSYY